MEVVEIKDEEKFNGFLSRRTHSRFLQSWQWGEFQKKVSGEIFRLGAEENGKLLAVATIVKKVLPMGKNYFYCPHGPVGGCQIPFALLFSTIREIARREKVMFLRFEPEVECQMKDWQIEKTLDVQPSKTIILDLAKSLSELLGDMHQKTRYNIRLAEKKGVEIMERGAEMFDKFWQLLGETSERDAFRLHGLDYYQEMIGLNREFIKLFFARYKDRVIATAIISFFGDTVTYVHGASGRADRNVMASYLLQWEMIKLGKKLGYKYYDFFGIDEEKWPGVTRFKNGFARPASAEPRQDGNEINYPGTFDLIFDPGWYSVYKMVRKIRRTF